MVNGSFDDWDLCLPLALYACRISPLSRIGSSPFQILYGRNPSSFNDNLVEKSFQTPLQILHGLNDTRSQIMKAIHLSRKTEIQKSSNKKQAMEFETGDVVYREVNPFEKIHKMNYKFDGPYRVVNKTKYKAYKIIGFDGIIRTVNRRKLVSGKEIAFDMEDGGMWQPISDKLTLYLPPKDL